MRQFGIEIEARILGSRRAVLDINDALLTAGLQSQVVRHGHENYNVWQVQDDGSLPDRTTCFEVASPRLTDTRDLETAVAAMVAAGANVNGRNTDRFGLHVHFDARDLSLQQVCAIALAYESAVDDFDAMLPLSRRDNFFCRPASHADRTRGMVDTVPALSRGAAGEALTEADRAALFGRPGDNGTHYAPQRYRKVNVMRYLRAANPENRTIEFRAHAGTVDIVKIKNWLLILANLIDTTLAKLATGATVEAGIVQTGQRRGQHRIVKPSGKFADFIAHATNTTATFDWTLQNLGWDRDATQANAAYVRSWGFPLVAVKLANPSGRGRAVLVGYRIEAQATMGRVNVTPSTALAFFRYDMKSALPADLIDYVEARKAAFAPRSVI